MSSAFACNFSVALASCDVHCKFTTTQCFLAILGSVLAGGTRNDDPTTTLGYDMADCWASCMIPFDWGLQYDPRGFMFVSEMVSGVYVVQFDEDFDPRYNYPALWTIEEDD